MQTMRLKCKAAHYPQRKGVAAVELAVCLPLIMLIAWGTIEACSMIYLKQSVKLAAFEGCRVGIVPTAKAADVTSQVGFILDPRKIKYTLRMSPANPSTLVAGNSFVVTISTQCRDNLPISSWSYSDKTISESVTMIKDN